MNDLPRGPRLQFRPLLPSDGYTVARWRNSESAHRCFFSDALVTPDSHAAFIQARKPDDLLWMVETHGVINFSDGTPVAMLSLTIDRQARTGEYGRAFLDSDHRGRGYWMEIESLLLDFAFLTLGLQLVWLEIFADNAEMVSLHRKYGWSESIQVHGDMDPMMQAFARISRELNGTIAPRAVLRMEYTPEQWRERRDDCWAQVMARAGLKA